MRLRAALAVLVGLSGLALPASGTPTVRAVDEESPISAGPLTVVAPGSWNNGMSGDGRYLLGGVPRNIRRYDTVTGEIAAVPFTFISSSSERYAIRLARDGGSVYVYTRNGLTPDDDGTPANTPDLFRWTFATAAWTLLTPGPTVLPPANSLPAVSDDGSVALLNVETQQFSAWANYRLDIASQTAVRIDGGQPSESAASLSADGRFAAYRRAGHAYLYDAVSGTSRLIDVDATGAPANGTGSSPSLARDGSAVIFGSTATNLAITGPSAPTDSVYSFDVDTGVITSRGSYYGVPVPRADGERLLFQASIPLGSTSTLRGVYVLDRRDGQPPVIELVSLVDGRPLDLASARLTDDGSKVVIASKYSIVDGAVVNQPASYARPLRTVSLPSGPPVEDPPLPPLGTIAAGPAENLLPRYWLGTPTKDLSLAWVHLNGIELGLYDRDAGVVREDTSGLTEVPALIGVPGGYLVSTSDALTPDDIDGEYYDVYRFTAATGAWTLVTGGLLDWLDWSINAASADGSTLVLSSFDEARLSYELLVFDVSSGTASPLGGDAPGEDGWIGQGPGRIDVSDDGRYVSFLTSAFVSCTRCRHAYVYDRVTQTYTLVDRGIGDRTPWSNAADPKISADGRSVVFRSDSFDLDADAPPTSGFGIYVHDLETGTIRRISPTGTSPSISRDGQRVAYVDDKLLWVNDNRSGTGAVREAMNPGAGISANGARGGAISPDGDEVLFDSGPFLPGDPDRAYSVYRRPLVIDDVPPTSTTSTSSTTTTTPTTTSSSTSTTSTTTSAPSSTAAPPTDPPTSTTVDVGPPDLERPLVAVTPARLLDTRHGSSTIDGAHRGDGPSAPGQITRLRVAGRGGVPAGSTAAALNVTATGAQAAGYATVWPCDDTPPVASNLNVAAGQTVANLVVSGLDASGDVCIRTSDGRFDVIVDAVAFTPAASGYVPLEPRRLLDTRLGAATFDGESAAGGPAAAGETVRVPVGGRGGVPVTPAAVALNITAVGADHVGYVTVWPCGEMPVASSLNLLPGSVAANFVLVPTDASGQICLRSTGARTELIVDVQGYVTAGGAFAARSPVRLLDTRPGAPTMDGAHSGGGRVAAGGVVELPIVGRAGVDATATAVVLNVTATGAAGSGYVTVWGCGDAPGTSTLNLVPGAAVPNAAVVALSDQGTVCLRTAEAETDLVVDLIGVVTG